MSHKLISHSPDLNSLRNEGFEISIMGAFVVVESVPYVTHEKKIKYGTLVCDLTIVGDKAAVPQNHVIYFKGDHPCNIDGSEITQITHQAAVQNLMTELVVDRSFSNNPGRPYSDFYEKIDTYVRIISAPAEALNSSVTARTFKVIEDLESTSVFRYIDTNSGRAKIYQFGEKLENQRIAIVGVGGTGSYVLDLVAKTPVKEIHLYDGDKFLQHNAFRAPGAASVGMLKRKSNKAKYFAKIYSRMRTGIIPHDYHLNSANVHELYGLDYIFICLDNGPSKKLIVDMAEAEDISFVDTGMGVTSSASGISAVLRTTVSIPGQRYGRSMISFSDADEKHALYETNIQIAELNSLNAVFAVIKWKKLSGFYNDFENEFNSTYTLDANMLLN